MRHLHIDIETYCAVDLTKTGVYRYAEDPTFQIILMAYSWDHGKTVIEIDLSGDTYPGQSVPDDVWSALLDPEVIKIAHNATFEMVCIGTYYSLPIDPVQWYCTMVGAAYLGLPLALDKIGQILGLANVKDKAGSALISYFCGPCRPTKVNGQRIRNLPEHAPDKWKAFISYNGQDVRTECDIYAYILRFPKPPAQERRYYVQDQIINGRGIALDVRFINAAIQANIEFLDQVHGELEDITGLSNVNSPIQLRNWLGDQLGYDVPSINKEYLNEALANDGIPEAAKRVIQLRQYGSRSSVSKYDTLRRYMCRDACIRGILQFNGANRTGRWAGRGFQPQNLKKTIATYMIHTAREAIKYGSAFLIFNDVSELVSKLVRTALVSRDGHTFAVADFSSIEGRVLSWLAGEDWKLEVYRTHGRMYEAMAAAMFNVPIESVTKESEYRAKGKIAELALGYQGAAGAMIKMGALLEGLTELELPGIVNRWRVSSPYTVKFWRRVENTARTAIMDQTRLTLALKYTRLIFSYESGYLFIELPSGRRLAYYGANVENGGRITYWGMDQEKKIWVKMQAYGGLLTENITQAIARDCLADSMDRMYDQVPILFHVHDEIVAEPRDEKAENTIQYMYDIIAYSPLWAKDLPLKADGWLSKYYKKD